MRQRPLEQISVPILDAEKDTRTILDVWKCRLENEHEDEDYIRKFVVTPYGETVRYEVKKLALKGLEDAGFSESMIAIELARNLVTLVFNELIRLSGERPELPQEILKTTSDKDAERLIDDTPPDPVT